MFEAYTINLNVCCQAVTPLLDCSCNAGLMQHRPAAVQQRRHRLTAYVKVNGKILCRRCGFCYYVEADSVPFANLFWIFF